MEQEDRIYTSKVIGIQHYYGNHGNTRLRNHGSESIQMNFIHCTFQSLFILHYSIHNILIANAILHIKAT